MENNQSWTTWEELLLTCAVKRYGLGDWNTIAVELQSRVSVSDFLFTAQICEHKYLELKRRFREILIAGKDVTPADGDVVGGDDRVAGDDCVPWLEELRKLRIEELREKVRGHDLSIQSLKSKAKRLEEEREKSTGNTDQKPDLDKASAEERSENDKIDVNVQNVPDNFAGVSASGDREDWSVNESSSTVNRQAEEKDGTRESDPAQTGSVKQDPTSVNVRSDSWNGSSEPSEEKRVDDESMDLRDSVAGESKVAAKENSDVLSSASLSRKGSDAGGNDHVDWAKKSEPLVNFLDIIRSNHNGSMFDVRLECQKTNEYKSMVRQHVDLETVQNRIENGSYASSTTKFYVDILLLVNNVIVFFPKSSVESAAAIDLRNVILNHIKNNCNDRQLSQPALLKRKPDSEKGGSLLEKQKSSAPLKVCRKRSSIYSKPFSSNKSEEKKVPNAKKHNKSSSNEEESSMELKIKDKPVTGARSMRRSNNARTNSTNTLVKNPITEVNSDSTSKVVDEKAEKKKDNVTSTARKRGGAAAAGFLKRIIEKTSPGKGVLLETLESSPEDGNNSSWTEARDQPNKNVDEQKEMHTRRKRGGGSGGRKQAKEEPSSSKRSVGRPSKVMAPMKRGRSGGEEEVVAKRPRKRSRR